MFNRRHHKQLAVPFRDTQLNYLLKSVFDNRFVCFVTLHSGAGACDGQLDSTSRTMLWGESLKRVPVRPNVSYAKRSLLDQDYRNWLAALYKRVCRLDKQA